MTDINVLNVVQSTVETTLKIPTELLDLDAEFESFGIDSIIAMELMTNLTKELGISITPSQFSDVNTVNQLVDVVASELTKTESAKEDSPKSEPPVIPSAAKPIVRTRRSQRKSRTAVPNRPGPRLIRKLNRLYSIKMKNNEYNSLEEVAEALVDNHLEEIVEHYGLDPLALDMSGSEVESTPAMNIDATSESIAIVGMSCRFPDAPDISAFWKNLVDEQNSVTEIPKSRWNHEDYFSKEIEPGKTVSKWGALIEDVRCFDHEFFGISHEEASMMDPQERLLCEEAYNAICDAAIPTDQLAGSKTGVFIGYEYGEYERHLRQNRALVRGMPEFTSSSPTYYLANRISYIFDLCGPSESINTNCASSAVALNRAFYSLRSYECDRAIVGGVSLNLFADDYIVASQYGMLSPSGKCAVFDNGADGFTRGEGVGVVVLRRASEARESNDRIYASIKNVVQNNRGKANSISEIKHEAITDVISSCYKKCSLEPDNVDYIEVDGYATKWGDSFEYDGIKNAFRTNTGARKFCALGSLKGNIGHLEPASGIASVIKIALSMYHKTFPATITKNKLNEFIDVGSATNPFYIAETELAFKDIRRGDDIPVLAGVNSFADSGANVHIVLEEELPEEKEVVNFHDSHPEVILLSAFDRASLEEMVSRLHTYVLSLGFDQNIKDSSQQFRRMLYTLQVGRDFMQERLAIVASNYEELAKKLNAMIEKGIDEAAAKEANGVYQSQSANSGVDPLTALIKTGFADTKMKEMIDDKQWHQLAILWTNKVDIPWAMGWNEAPEPITLPSYSFAKTECWIEGQCKIQSVPNNSSSGVDYPLRGGDSKAEPKHEEYVAPRNELESDLVEIWANVLEVDKDKLGVNDSFFDLGGHSLLATQLVSKVRNRLQTEMPLEAFFNVSTVAGTASVISAINNQVQPPEQNQSDVEFEEISF